MSMLVISIGLDYTVTPDLPACLKEALLKNYSFIVSPIVHPRLRRGAGNIAGFTRSDMILGPKDWTTKVVGKLSPHLDVDCPSPIARQRNEDCLNEELAYCGGLGLHAIMLSIHGRETNNLARILQSYLESSQYLSCIWTKVPMVCHKTLRQSTETDIENEEAWKETWHWWSKFHERLEFDKRVGVVLELTADLPSQELINRWLGEPIKAVMIPTSIFKNNKRGFSVLPKPYQPLIISMLERGARLILCGALKATLEHYWRYLQNMWKKRPNQLDPMVTYAQCSQDLLHTPLQPLADNLDTHTYNVFETDTIKYEKYQHAIVQALIDIQKKEKSISESENIENHNHDVGQVDCKNKPVTVMILGAGRGPLVRATFNAADITKTQVKVIAVEKNPCAVVALTAQVREVWRERDVTVVPGDMRQLNISPKADIIVSELLGSWADNELSPECLDGAAGLLKADGISIPNKYTSYVAPIMSARIWATAAKTEPIAPNSLYNRDKNLETLWVVYMRNKYDIAEPQPLFTFEHPAEGVKNHEGEVEVDFRGLPVTDNRRWKAVTWKATQDSILHGFEGYFDCSLYGNEMISIVPSTHTPSLISWFPMFIPIKTPMRVEKGEEIKATFWRCVNSRRVWYEWAVEVGNRTSTLHNSNGRSSEMLLYQ